VTNSGTLRAANGCSLEANVNNSGTIVADGGAMTLFSYTNTGHISAINGGSIELRLAPDSGNISADGATLILDGAFTTAQLRAVSLTNATVALNITATMNNTGDTLTLADNTLSFTGTIEPGLTGGAVTGGAIVTTGSGRVVVPSGKTGALNGVLLNGALAMQGGTLNVTNGLTLDSSRLSGTGTIDLIGSADDNFLKPIGTSLAVPQGLTIRADSGASLGTSEGTLINSGTLSAQGAGKTFNVLGFVTNNGTVEARNGATLTIASPQQLSKLAGSTLTGGSWSAYAGSTLNLPSASIKTNNSANILLDGSGSSFPAIAALAINEGTFSVNHGASFITAGGLANTGTLSMAQGTFTVPGTLTNSGTITLDRSSLTVAALDGQGGQITLATDPASGKALNIGSPSGASAYGGKISGAGTLLKSGASVQTLSGANSIGTVNVSGGMIDFGATQQAKQLIIGAGAAAALTPGGGKALSVNSLSVAGAPGNWTGVLDLDDGSLNISYGLDSPRATIASLLVSGYAGGTWTGPGIHSSQAANDPVHAALGYADGTDGIVPRLLAGGLLVKYTHPGDANLDGAVNFTDLLDFAQRYGRSGSWDTGDFNYDGTVGFDDLLALAQNYGASPTAAELARLTPETRASVMSAFAAVPEPGAFGLTCLVALGLGGRRRLANRAAAAIIRPSSSEAVESACNRSV